MGWFSFLSPNAASQHPQASKTPAEIFPGAAPQTTREHPEDAELEGLLTAFEAAERSTTTTTTTSSSAPSPLRPCAPHPDSRTLEDGGLDISPEATYPRTMSCREQFDQAFYCQSLGGKFNDIYRYGHLRSCSEQWGAFWFCMRNRSLPERERGERIKNFYKAREERRKAEHGSSEDVWPIRTRAVERAFWRDPDVDEEIGGARVIVKE